MKKEQILVDMDGVLANVYKQFSKQEKDIYGIDIDIKSIKGKTEADFFPDFKEIVNSKGFFLKAPVIDGAVEGLKYLNDKYNVLIVSAATEFSFALAEKVYWLEKHFPFISKQRIILCGNKNNIIGDIMIDDHMMNLNQFDGRKILFTQPHNADELITDFHRVFSWEEIIQIL